MQEKVRSVCASRGEISVYSSGGINVCKQWYDQCLQVVVRSVCTVLGRSMCASSGKSRDPGIRGIVSRNPGISKTAQNQKPKCTVVARSVCTVVARSVCTVVARSVCTVVARSVCKQWCDQCLQVVVRSVCASRGAISVCKKRCYQCVQVEVRSVCTVVVGSMCASIGAISVYK